VLPLPLPAYVTLMGELIGVKNGDPKNKKR